MSKRRELLSRPEYWFEQAQNELFRQVSAYLEKEGINKKELADRLGVSKGYVSQILSGNFNYTLKKLIEVSLAIGKVPEINYKTVDQKLIEDENVSSSTIKAESEYGALEPTTTLHIVYTHNRNKEDLCAA